VAVSYLVRHPHSPPAGVGAQAAELLRRRSAVYIHHLPVDQPFTLAAGRQIWGYPKTLAAIDIDTDATSVAIRLEDDGRHVLTLQMRTGGPIRQPAPALDTYTFCDGVLRRTTWRTEQSGTGGRLGGARITLGSHPIADELRALGLGRRALMCQSARQVHASFDAPSVVEAGGWPDA
jgi:hypothetical protein